MDTKELIRALGQNKEKVVNFEGSMKTKGRFFGEQNTSHKKCK